MFNAVSTSLSPNTESDDVFIAISLVLQPWNLTNGNDIDKLEAYFRMHFSFDNSYSFNSGRSCLLAILDAIDLSENDEVIVQSYTCNAVINPILKKRGKPVYVDIKSDLNIDAQKIESKITPRTKAIIAQHTFGMPCDIEIIKDICNRRNIILIEDCAHALGARYKNKYCGTFGDFAFFSFGRDKVVSSVYGGMLVVNNKGFVQKVEIDRKKISFPERKWTLQQLLHPIITNLFVLPFYNTKIGKGVLAYSLNLKFLSKAVTEEENKGVLPEYFPRKMPNALACLALNQIKKIEKFNLWRKGVANFYRFELGEYNNLFPFGSDDETKDPIYMRFPMVIENSEELIDAMKKKNIYLNDGWRESVIVPVKTDTKIMGYIESSCPVAEVLCKKIVSLPTHIRLENRDMKNIVTIVKEHLERIKSVGQD